MNIPEANATATFLRFLLPQLDPVGAAVPADEAREAAAYLAERANRALTAGPTGADVDELWHELLEALGRCDCALCVDPEPTGRPVITVTTTGDLL